MITKRNSTCDAWLTLAGVLVALSGCNSADPWPRVAVRGNVTLDGKPLPKGEVRFIPLDETPGPKTSVPVIDGQFAADELTGPVVGRHRIEINSTDDGGIAFDDEQAAAQLQSNPRRITVLRVPITYNEQSSLVEEVSAEGPNEFQFDLTTTPRYRR